MTLHQAIEEVILTSKKDLTAIEIANVINEQKSYVRKDEELISPTQIRARINSYSSTFKIDDEGMISLYPTSAQVPKNLIRGLWSLFDLLSSKRSSFGTGIIVLSILLYIRKTAQKHLLLSNDEKLDYSRLDNIYKFYEGKEHQAVYSELLSRGFRELMFHEEWQDSISSWMSSYAANYQRVSNKVISEIVDEFVVFRIGADLGHHSSANNLSRLFNVLTKDLTFENVLDPAMGIGLSLFSIISSNNTSATGIEINNESVVLAKLISKIKDFANLKIIEGDSFMANIDSTFDLIALEPPLRNQRVDSFNVNPQLKKELFKLYNGNSATREKRKSIDVLSLFITLGINRLSKKGTFIILVPETFLFSKEYEYLRKYLLENKLLNGIISLPAGSLSPLSQVKTSVLIIKKEENHKVLLIDALYLSTQKGKELILNVDDIKGFYDLAEDRKDICAVRSSVELEKSPLFNLSVSRNILINLQAKYLILGDLLWRTDNEKVTKEDNYENIIRIKDLKNSKDDYTLHYYELDSIADQNTWLTSIKNSRYRKLDEDAILVAKVGQSLKATIFRAHDSIPVLIDKNIEILIPKQGIRYKSIISSFYKNEFIKLVNSITSGSGIPSRRTQDLLSLPISYNSELDEKIDKVISESITAVADIDMEKLYGAFHHDFSNPLATLKLDYTVLRKALVRADKNKEIARFLHLPAFEKSNESIEDYLNAIDSHFRRIETILNSNEILFTGKLKKAQFSLKEKIEYIYSRPEYVNRNAFNLKVSGDVTEKFDEDQIERLITNIFDNAISHGRKNSEKINLLFDIKYNAIEGKVEILYFNDGNPFPDNFSLEDYLSPKKKGETSGGSGNGGFIINQIIKNHSGTIDRNWDTVNPKYYFIGKTYNFYLRFKLKVL